MNGKTDTPHRTFTVSGASLINSTDTVEFDLSSNTNGEKIIAVVFKDSVLKFVPQQVFVAFPGLQVLFIDGQQLVDLKQNYFTEATSLRTLWAPNNEITQIGANTFFNLTNLYTVDLSNNPIDYIHSLGFNKVPSLTILNLSGTKLMKLNFDSFWFSFQLNDINFLNANGNTNCLNEHFKPTLGDLKVLKEAIKKCEPSQDNKTAQKMKDKAMTDFQMDLESMNETISNLKLKVKEKDEQILVDKATILNLQTDLLNSIENQVDECTQAIDLNKVLSHKVVKLESGDKDCGSFPLLTKQIEKDCLTFSEKINIRFGE